MHDANQVAVDILLRHMQYTIAAAAAAEVKTIVAVSGLTHDRMHTYAFQICQHVTSCHLLLVSVITLLLLQQCFEQRMMEVSTCFTLQKYDIDAVYSSSGNCSRIY
jgi:hypothetical protein